MDRLSSAPRDNRPRRGDRSAPTPPDPHAGTGDARPLSPQTPQDDLTRGMVEIRHVPGETRAAYNEIYRGRGIKKPERLWRWLLETIEARPGQRLLDVACGEGGLVRHAAGNGLEAWGVDLSEAALEIALRAPAPAGIGLAVANGERLPFPDGAFERVTNIGSLEHYRDPVRGAAEMARVLAPDGLACVIVPNSFGLRWSVLYAWRHGDVQDDGQPIQRYGTPAQWARLLRAGGLRVERVLGYEALADRPESLGEWLGVLRHPSRLLVPLAPLLPASMASELVFLCRRQG